MESRDLLSRPIFASLSLERLRSRLGLGLEGFRSRDFAYSKKWLIKISIIQIFLFAVFASKKQPKHDGKMPKTWKNSSQKHGGPQKLFQGGKLDILFILSMLLTIQCQCTFTERLCPFYLHHNENAPCYAGGGRGGHNSLGAGSLWGRHKVSPNNVTNTFFNTVHLLPNDLRFKHRVVNLLLAPGAIKPLTSLLLQQQSQKSHFVDAAMLRFHSCFYSLCTVQNYEAYHY